MTQAESHFLNCINPDCERAYCVAQRDYQQQIAKQEMELFTLLDAQGFCEYCSHCINSETTRNATNVENESCKHRSVPWRGCPECHAEFAATTQDATSEGDKNG